MKTATHCGLGDVLPRAQEVFRLRGLPTICLTASLSFLFVMSEAGQSGIFTYEENGASVTITDVVATTNGPVAIPAEINGKPVRTIAPDAFNDCEGITSVAFPPGVIEVSSPLFRGCNSLTSFSVDGAHPTLRAIDGVVFDSTETVLIAFPTGRAGSYTAPEGTLEIAPNAFQGNHLIGNVVLPEGLLRIGDLAFESCFALISVDCPSSVETIGMLAFSECHLLQSFEIPDSLIEIGNSAFSACRSLQSVTMPQTLEALSPFLFSGCWSLQGIDLPENLTQIPEGAFRDCTILANVVLPPAVTSIGNDAFAFCDGIAEMTLPGGVRHVGDRAFAYCKNLENINFPDGLETIGEEAFSFCDKLESAVLPDSVETLGIGAFRQCPELSVAELPANLVEISASLFEGCTRLTSIELPGGITSVGQGAFQITGLTSVVIPDGTTFIGESAFNQCESLQEVTIPGTVTVIDHAAFRSCSGLSEILLPDGLTSIGDWTFAFCTGLTSIHIPASVEILGEWLFYGCTSLQSIEVEESNPNYCDEEGVLFDRLKTTLLQYPPGRGAPPADALRQETSFPLAEAAEDEPAYRIPATVTGIGKGAFATSGYLNGVSIAAAVAEIGQDAFADCSRLDAITVDVENPAYNVVDGYLLTADGSELVRAAANRSGTVRIPDGVTQIRSTAFSACTGIEGVAIVASVSQIGERAFAGCTNLSRATFFGNSPALAADAFLGTDPGFGIFYFHGRPTFTSPMWAGYPAFDMGGESAPVIWLLENGFHHDVDLRTDPNGDGQCLLLEYAFRLDPRQFQPGSMPQPPAFADDHLSFRFYSGSPGIIYRIQISTNLKDWTTDGVSLSEPDQDLYRTATFGGNTSAHFMRVVVEEMP